MDHPQIHSRVVITKLPYYRLYNNWVQPKPTLFPVKELNWKNNNNKTLLVVCLKLLTVFFVLTEKQISGHHFNDLHFIQVKNNPRSCEVNLSNCVRSLKKIQDFNGIPFFFVVFLFCFFCFRHTLQRSQLRGSFFTWFHFRSSHIWFISYTFVTLHLIVLLKISSILFINASSDKFAKFKTFLLYTKISAE